LADVNSSFEQVYDELTEEHRELMSLVDRIRGHRGVLGLGPILEQLHTMLIRHFSHEQFPGGLYECMGAYGSRYHDELKILVEDHCTILSSVRGVVERTRTPQPRDEATLLADVGEILQRLNDHERREHALADKLMSLSR